MKLQVYVSQHCVPCSRSAALGQAVASHFEDMTVEVLNLDDPAVSRPDLVFAVPTFLLDGWLLCLGNQEEEWLIQRVQRVQRVMQDHSVGALRQGASGA